MEVNTMNELLDLIANTGFPIVVSIYLLIRIENKLFQLSTAISELREAIITLTACHFSWNQPAPMPPEEGKSDISRLSL